MIPKNKIDYPFPLSNIARVGRQIIELANELGYAARIGCECLLYLSYALKRWRSTMRQMYICGIGSLGVVLVVAAFTGMILAIQTGMELQKYGQEAYIGGVVSISLCREMGPFMTGLILAAAVGSSMAAELGTMAVSEELEALEIMSINPVRYLMTQRVLAMMIMCPAVTVVTDFVGVLGGAIVGYTNLGVPFGVYYDNVIQFLSNDLMWGIFPKDIFTGLVKALIFGFVIGVICCSQGFRTTNGAMGVGESTRKSVVYCYLLVIILGYFLTFLFYFSAN